MDTEDPDPEAEAEAETEVEDTTVPTAPPAEWRRHWRRWGRTLTIIVTLLLVYYFLLYGIDHVAEGRQARDFELTVVHSADNTSDADFFDYLDRPVVLEFFFPGCGVCGRMAENGELDDVAAMHGDEVWVVYVDGVEQDAHGVDDFRTEHELTGIFGIVAKTVPLRYGVFAYPVLYVIDADGEIAYRHSGYTSGEDVMDELAPLL